MNTYKVGEQTLAIIDGQLWHRVESLENEGEAESDTDKVKPPKTSKKPRKVRAGAISEEAKDEIRQKFSEGVSRKELAKEYKVAVGMIYYYIKTKPMSQRTKNNPVGDYTCVNGHEFKSKLLPGQVMCPTCHSDDCDLGTLNGPVKETI
jgi:hypothetical protein